MRGNSRLKNATPNCIWNYLLVFGNQPGGRTPLPWTAHWLLWGGGPASTFHQPAGWKRLPAEENFTAPKNFSQELHCTHNWPVHGVEFSLHPCCVFFGAANVAATVVARAKTTTPGRGAVARGGREGFLAGGGGVVRRGAPRLPSGRPGGRGGRQNHAKYTSFGMIPSPALHCSVNRTFHARFCLYTEGCACADVHTDPNFSSPTLGADNTPLGGWGSLNELTPTNECTHHCKHAT